MDPWITDDLYLHPCFKEYFDMRSGMATNGPVSYTHLTDIAADDILIVEKSSGTKTIKYSDLMNAVKVSLGIVDTLEITEKG